VSPRSLGIYTYQKALGSRQSIPVVVRVFPLEAREMLRTYPETGQRRVKWFPPDKAAQRVAEPDLAALIRGFSPDSLDGTPEASPEAATNPDAGESI
jgi:hypothetical protein